MGRRWPRRRYDPAPRTFDMITFEPKEFGHAARRLGVAAGGSIPRLKHIDAPVILIAILFPYVR